MTEPVTLEFLARQQESILSELVRMGTVEPVFPP